MSPLRGLRFRARWRPYQERVLAELGRHVADRRFHLVAAPGSGKTVIGLEVLRRLQRPALVLAPSLAIRDQWLQRLSLFLPDDSASDGWVSRDLRRPGVVTATTYQSLHAATRDDGGAAVFARLAEVGVETLVLDEAHHLRRQWWEALRRLETVLERTFIVALTATPPYDASQLEWNRYIEACGPIDAEISVPELVRTGTLCPHQDLIYLSQPSDEERAAVASFATGVRSFLADLALDADFIAAVRAHPAVREPHSHLDLLLERGAYVLSMLLFLAHSDGVVPEPLLRAFGLVGASLPRFGEGAAEVLLGGALFHDRGSFAGIEQRLERHHEALRGLGAIERRRVALRESPRLNRRLRASLGKLRSVADVVELESRILDHNLRMVVLTDHIHRDAFPSSEVVDKPLHKLGVVPIFETVRRLRLPGVSLGILTGRLVVLPRAALERLRVVASARGLAAAAIQVEPLWHDDGFAAVSLEGDTTASLVALVTELFTAGDLTVLVGTAALLGEGWDAPAINSLVLATTIGSHVGSNQMRGRALRADPAAPTKASNIWHLACVGVGAGDEDDGFTLERSGDDSDDLELLRRRFRTFVGLVHDRPRIESGLERIGLGGRPAGDQALRDANAAACGRCDRRAELLGRWRAALEVSGPARARQLTEQLEVRDDRIASHGLLAHLARARRGPLDWLRRWLLVRRVRQVAEAVLRSLGEAGAMVTPRAELAFEVRAATASFRCSLRGCTRREEEDFVAALRQVFDPMQTPRYLLATRRSTCCVPALLGRNRAGAEAFQRHWRATVGRAELLAVRSETGKRRLLRAREGLVAATFAAPTTTRRVWE